VKAPTLEEKYMSMVSGETTMRFRGATARSGFAEGGPADVKKTFVYN
jgi:hypothetical protein